MRSPIGVEDMVFGENFYDSVQCAVCSVQCAGGGEARLSGMSGVRYQYLHRPEDQQSAVTDFPPTTNLWELVQTRVGESSVPEHFPSSSWRATISCTPLMESLVLRGRGSSGSALCVGVISKFF